MTTSRVDEALRRMGSQRLLSDDQLPAAPEVAPWQVAREHEPNGLVAVSRPRRRWVLAGGAAVTAAAVAVSALLVANMSAAPAYAATPANLHYSHTAGGPDAALRQLAARTRNATPVRGAGRYHYVHTRGWYLHADADLHNRVQHSGIAAVDRQQWIAADGSGRLKVVSAGKQIMPTGTYAAGGLAPSGIAASASAAQIRKRHHVRPTAASWIAEINEVWSDQVVPPGLQATLLRELASQPHLTLLGTTTDRAGRRGLAVSATSVSGKSRERSVLILDQRTGMLLDAETMALTAGSLPVKAPATTAYTVWLTQGFTNTTQRVP